MLSSDTYDLDLIKIGEGSVVDRSSVISPHTRERDIGVFDKVKIGHGCVIG